ncbi:hypothetical protein ZWY2020_000997 [Hordeum vulgare]|nr:hypothetical protein ZWY2020_000997 [Hordeum vulgare]
MAPTRPRPVLPDDIIQVEIFARLPAKSAFRCRCLSRAWAAALPSDDFTDRHQSIHGGRLKLLRLLDDPSDSSDHDEEAKLYDVARAPPSMGIPIAVAADRLLPTHHHGVLGPSPARGILPHSPLPRHGALPRPRPPRADPHGNPLPVQLQPRPPARGKPSQKAGPRAAARRR